MDSIKDIEIEEDISQLIDVKFTNVLLLKPGDIVNFIGNKYYSTSSSEDAIQYICLPGLARVIKINQTGEYQYFLQAIEDSESDVYGWVEAQDIASKESSVTKDIFPVEENIIASKPIYKYTENNQPLVCLMTNSTCYLSTKNMIPKGIVWHSTGMNNAYLYKYVQPSLTDPNYQNLIELLGKNTYGNDWNHTSHQEGYHCWIGKLKDNTVAAVQTLPWNYIGWGCGAGTNGSCNDCWIQLQICEDNLSDPSYFSKAYREACEITAYLCKKYNINPMGTVQYKELEIPTILCHQDTFNYQMGTNCSDIYHWFSLYNRTMDDVRQKVFDIMQCSEGLQFTHTQHQLVDTSSQFIPYQIQVVSHTLNIRSGPSMEYKIKSTIHKDEIYTIIDEKNNWGKLESDMGWINLKYTEKI